MAGSLAYFGMVIEVVFSLAEPKSFQTHEREDSCLTSGSRENESETRADGGVSGNEYAERTRSRTAGGYVREREVRRVGHTYTA